jgi:hypothetical protein
VAVAARLDPRSGSRSRSEPRRNVLAVAALVAAVSPTLVELARQLVAEPATRYALLFPMLLVRAARHEKEATPSRAGYALLAAGLALELLGFGGGMPKLARPGLPLAVIGLCLALGLASWRTSLLALWIVPVPYAVCSLVSPGLELLWYDGAVGLVNAVTGAGLAIAPSRDFLFDVVAGAGTLAVRSWEGGLPLAALLAGLGWYAGRLQGATAGRGLRKAGLAGVVGLLLQAPIVAVSVALLAAGEVGAAGAVRDHAFWLVAAGGLLWAERAAVPAAAAASRWEPA